MNPIIGSDGNDSFTGTAGDDEMFGLGGNDWLRGMEGNDHLLGGDGNDQLDGYAGNDWLEGGAGDDLLSGGGGYVDPPGPDVLDGGPGSDTAVYTYSPTRVIVDLNTGTGYGGAAEGDTLISIENLNGSFYDDVLIGDDGANTLKGDYGDDILIGGAGDDVLHGGRGVDLLVGGAGSDTAVFFEPFSSPDSTINLALGTTPDGDILIGIENVATGNGNDTLIGDDGDNVLNAGGGRNLLIGGLGADTLIGGSGLDTADYSASDAAVTVSLASGEGSGGHAEGDRLQGIDRLIGSLHGDRLTGDDNANVLLGGAGDDHLSGAGGNDELTGGAGADVLDGGSGLDWALYASTDGTASAGAVSVNLLLGMGTGGDAEGDTFTGIENVRGTEYADTLIGDDADNVLEGGGGADDISGGAGNDSIIIGAEGAVDGGAGEDWLELDLTAAGDVVLDGERGFSSSGAIFTDIEHLAVVSGDGADSLSGLGLADIISGGGGNDSIMGLGGDDRLDGQDGDDTVRGGDGNDRIQGGHGSDWLFGDDGDDFIYGDGEFFSDNSRDYLRGGAGNDYLRGDGGHDSLRGGDGDDILVGAGGNDYLVGGAGSDTFVMGVEASSRDRIVDFTAGEGGDTIHIEIGLTYRAGMFSFEDVLSHASQTDEGTYLDFSRGSPWTFGVLIQDVEIADLMADNFTFHLL
ncbi:hypothetical protein GCM10007301_42750 [Azorhizobium oxalatiphilum]|uniref:Calcium-binding protein n=1 Tax=Azorhizobium oxalatiphilum TaxID=980631 RepID=A0A917C9W2_9HYPH|nr:calcium-binding protein [Azorhizobium oxalatiphilum]GGF78213.1 hypothetical protein GCM10007301_42750 [Azorhizobium oxalatiphilum]